MKEQSLASQGVFEKYGRKSQRELFLDEMERWFRGRRWSLWCVRTTRRRATDGIRWA